MKIARTEKKLTSPKNLPKTFRIPSPSEFKKSNKPMKKPRRAEKAPFVVLIGADMPSILTEDFVPE